MKISLFEDHIAGYAVNLYLDDDEKDANYWLQISKDNHERLYQIVLKRKGESEQVMKCISEIKVITIEKLMSLDRVSGFSAGRLIRYIQNGKKIDKILNLLAMTITVTLSFIVFTSIIHLNGMKLYILGAEAFSGGLVMGFLISRYKVYKERFIHDR